ncbi:MAG: hypothetical protein JWM31_152 [Solirubrobacterales bacterium]|nr:hypothetical protein [Solirubrobacterales bacterium]
MIATVLSRELLVLREDPALLEAARSSSSANLALIVEIVQGRLQMEDFVPPPQAVAFARELARRNVAVAELGRAYRLAQRALWRWAVSEVHERIDDPVTVAAAIEGLSEAAFATGDLLSTVMMERYARERESWMRSAAAVRGATVQAILAGDQVDVFAAGQQLGYELRQEHQAFLVWCETGDGIPERCAAAVGGSRALMVPFGVGLVAGWAPPASIDVAAADGSARVALGVPASGVSGFCQSHGEAVEARRVAAMSGQRADSPVYYDDVALLALLTRDHQSARTFAARVLGPLAADDKVTRRLVTTLLVVLQEQGSPRRAGQRLGVHENTIAKRLRAIEARGGPTVGSGEQAAKLVAALMILEADRDADSGT